MKTSRNKWDILTSFAPKFVHLGSSSVHCRLIHDTNINPIWRVLPFDAKINSNLFHQHRVTNKNLYFPRDTCCSPSFSLHAKSMYISYDLLLPRTQNISNYVSRGLFTARDCGCDTENGARTTENNGSWGPCRGSVWTFLHNVLESIDPGPILSPISGPAQCEYTLTLFDYIN